MHVALFICLNAPFMGGVAKKKKKMQMQDVGSAKRASQTLTKYTYRNLFGLKISPFAVSVIVVVSMLLVVEITVWIFVWVTIGLVGITFWVAGRVTLIRPLTMYNIITKEISITPPYFWPISCWIIKNFFRIEMLRDKLHSPRIVPIFCHYSVNWNICHNYNIQFKFSHTDICMHTWCKQVFLHC